MGMAVLVDRPLMGMNRDLSVDKRRKDLSSCYRHSFLAPARVPQQMVRVLDLPQVEDDQLVHGIIPKMSIHGYNDASLTLYATPDGRG